MQAASFTAAMRGVPVLQSNRRASNARVQTSSSSTVTRASIVAEPASLEVKSADGSSSGKASLSLRVADAETANGLVHRYVVMVRQNMRQVRMHCSIGGRGGVKSSSDSLFRSFALSLFRSRCIVVATVDCRGMPRRSLVERLGEEAPSRTSRREPETPVSEPSVPRSARVVVSASGPSLAIGRSR